MTMTTKWHPACACALALLCFALPAFAQDTGAAADSLIRRIRVEHFDQGHYGSVTDTCRVLDALSRSPRRYNELDGPFFRLPAERIADSSGGRDRVAWKALALAGTVTRALTHERDRSLSAVLSESPSQRFLSALVLATLAPDSLAELRAHEQTESEQPGLIMLLAADPALVPAPPLEPLGPWLQWARAARLRAVPIVERPALPDPGPAADLRELLDALNLVLVLHGLPSQDGPSMRAQEEAPPLPPRASPGRTLEASLASAWDYFQATQTDGTFGLDLPFWEGPQTGITALNLSGTLYLAQRLERPRPPWVDAGLDWLAAQQHPDGSIHEGGLAVYTTSAVIGALVDGGREQDRPIIERARAFLVIAQADEGEGYSAHDDPHYGGIGYGGDERPDLSNTQMALEAAARAGMSSDSAMFRKARRFLEGNQNDAESGGINIPRAEGGRFVSGTDGGATYMPGNSPAGEDPVGGDRWVARSYGSMTYALTKSFLLCGLQPGDRRLDAAVRWLADHYTLETNPGFSDPEQGAQGLYYYYLAMATTLERLPNDSFLTSAGQQIPWRSEITRHLVDEQRVNGSWINEGAGRWWEASPALCTGYALLTLRSADS